MSTTKQIGQNSYLIPSNSEAGGSWGEECSAAFIALIDQISGISNANDILPATATISNNISSNTAIAGLNFSSSLVKAAVITYYITRTAREFGTILVMYDGSSWKMAQGSRVGRSGVALDIDSSGQVVYQSSNGIAGTMNFSAKIVAV